MANENIEESLDGISTDLGEIKTVLSNALGAIVEELSGIRNEIANLKG